MNGDDVKRMVDERVTPLEQALEDFIKSEKEGRLAMTSLITRLTVIVAGDKEFEQPGLIQKIQGLEAFKAQQQALVHQGQGFSKATVLIIGGLFTLLNLAIQVLL